jgi:hypothetical protein
LVSGDIEIQVAGVFHKRTTEINLREINILGSVNFSYNYYTMPDKLLNKMLVMRKQN